MIRTPSPQTDGGEAYFCLTLVGILIVVTTVLGVPIQFGITLAAAVSFLMALRLGFNWEKLEVAISYRIGRLSGTMLIMWMIGFLLGNLWKAILDLRRRFCMSLPFIRATERVSFCCCNLGLLDFPSGVMIQETELFQNQNVFLAVGPEVYV